MRVSKAKLREYEAMRKVIPAYERRMILSINSKRNVYVATLLKSIKGKSVEQAKSIIKKAGKETYLTQIYVNLYGTLGLHIAKAQNKIISTQKADENILEAEWLKALDSFAKEYAGIQIVTLTGTLKDRILQYLDTIVADAVNQGLSIESVTNDIVKKMGDTYTEETKWMARRIAHTETMKCASEAQSISVESLGIRYIKIWQITGINTRSQHKMMQGVSVEDKQPFTMPNGDRMMYPQDSSMGAQAENIVNCSCFVIYEPLRR